MSKVAIVVLCIGVLLLGFCAGGYTMERWYGTKPLYVAVPKPVYIGVPYPVTRYVDVERLVYMEVIKEVEVIREVIVDRVIQLEDWESVKELEAFLARDDTDSHVIFIAGGDGIVRFNNQCEDIALQLRDRAMAEGKHLSVIALSPDEHYKWYGERLASHRYHAICMARIGNEFWYVDPDSDKHWLALYLD